MKGHRFYDSSVKSVRLCSDNAIEVEYKPVYQAFSVDDLTEILDRMGYDVTKRATIGEINNGN